MSKRLWTYLPLMLLVLLTNLAGILSFHESRRQQLLTRQLEQSVAMLATINGQLTQTTTNALEQVKSMVERNQNQPAVVARQRRVERLHGCVVAACDSLRTQAALLRRRTGNATAPARLRVPDSQPFRMVYQVPVRRWLALRQQLAACADTLHRVAALPTGPLPALPAPTAALTVVEALADLTRAEHLLLVAENRLLHQEAQAMARQTTWAAGPVALATADNGVVAPGDTYRGRLLVVGCFGAGLKLQMACNGHPVPVNATGIGQVRFRAPVRPGPATWTGTIRMEVYGRNTTFRVRVPYRVARR